MKINTKMTYIKNITLLSFCFFFFSYSVIAQYEELLNNYDILSTIAGKGEIENGGINGWLEEYEGGLAINAELSRPHFAMADSNNNIYIADKDAHAIRMIQPNGSIITVAGTSVAGDNGDGLATEHQLNSPNGIWVQDDGTVYILDLGNNKIRKLTTEGNLETIVDDQSGISLGRGLWVSQDKDTIWYASGSQIKIWTSTGGITTYSSGFSSLGNITADINGHIVATDRTANLVYRISADGSKEIIAGNGLSSGGGDGHKAIETGLFGVRGVWFLEDNSYLLATHEGSQVWYVDLNDTIHLFLDGREGDEFHSGDGENFKTPGYKISEARAVTTDYYGNILIIENDLGYIRRIAKKGFTPIREYDASENNITILTYPNPLNHSTTIRYTLPKSGPICLKILDYTGKIIEILKDEYQNQGEREIEWQRDKSLPGGVYLIILEAGNHSLTRKLIVL